MLKQHIIYILELPEEYEETLTITGISIKYEDEGIGVVISALKGLDSLDAPLCLNTPYIPPQRNENTHTPMCGTLEMAVDKITSMAQQFVGGMYRAQGQLFEKESANGKVS